LLFDYSEYCINDRSLSLETFISSENEISALQQRKRSSTTSRPIADLLRNFEKMEEAKPIEKPIGRPIIVYDDTSSSGNMNIH